MPLLHNRIKRRAANQSPLYEWVLEGEGKMLASPVLTSGGETWDYWVELIPGVTQLISAKVWGSTQFMTSQILGNHKIQDCL